MAGETNQTAQPPQSPTVGEPAPAFDLPAVGPNLQHVQVSRDAYSGRWFGLIFYPRDFSFVCPTELIGFSAEIEQFERRNCGLLGISIDDLETHQRWMQTPAAEGGVDGLRFPLASDVSGDVCKAYGLWRENEALPNRGLFLVDPHGVLRYSVVFDMSVGRNVDDVTRVLDALQSGGVCPANWKNADGVLDIGSLLQPGRVLAHYRIDQVLGVGGFGRVLAADDLRLGRKVALKVLSRQSDATEDRLLDEARMAAKVNHPNVCTIYAVDVIDTLPTIVMEFIDGPSLAMAIHDGLDKARFQAIAVRLAEGLAAAHRQEVIHGDIKPANVLLRGESDPVLVDFGLARPRVKARSQIGKTLFPMGSDQPPRVSVGKSELGSLDSTIDLREDLGEDLGEDRGGDPDGRLAPGISGTPAYMSPEQARGQLLCQESDVFSLGLLFLEMLTGCAPLKTMPAVQILRSLQDPGFLETLASHAPESHRRLLADLFALDPASRPTAADVAARFAKDP